MGDPAALVSARTALDGFFDAFYRRHPVTATFTGVHEHDHLLPDWSPAGLEAAAREMRALRTLLDQAGRVADDQVREFPDHVDLALADACLEIQLAEDASGHFRHRNPALWTGEAVFSVIALVTREFRPLDARLDAAVTRMRGIATFLEAARQTIVAAPEAWRARALRECQAAEILFGRSLPQWLRRAAPGRGDAIEACDEARSAFARFQSWMAAELPVASTRSCSAGEALLSLLLRRGHWCSAPASTLLAEARVDLGDAHERLDDRIREAGAGSWAEALARIEARRPEAPGYLASFDRVWRRCHDAVLTANVVSWPAGPIQYVPIPDHTRDAAPLLYYLFYRSPAPFDRLPLHEYVVTPLDGLAVDEAAERLRVWNDSAILLNHVVHHGGLGHHVQNAHACRCRSRLGQVAAVDAASRISMFCGGSLAEGWACYACDLAEELGLLSVLDRVSQEHTRVRLAARAVADLSLHTGVFTFEETVLFYEARGLMPRATAQAEAVKTSMFPGTAVMYWLGTRGIHRLRRAHEAAPGSGFSLRAFHDELLSHGAIPVELIARLMTRDASGLGVRPAEAGRHENPEPDAGR
jgi:uncharacterized protein (DUF885 family)